MIASFSALQEPSPAPKGGLLYDILHLGDSIKAKLQPLAQGLDGALPNIRADPVGDFLDSAASAADWEPQKWDPLRALFDSALWHGNVQSKYDPIVQMNGLQVRDTRAAV